MDLVHHRTDLLVCSEYAQRVYEERFAARDPGFGNGLEALISVFFAEDGVNIELCE